MSYLLLAGVMIVTILVLLTSGVDTGLTSVTLSANASIEGVVLGTL